MDEAALEKIIADLVKRKWDDATGDAERAMINRVLNGLRYTYEQAGPIWESLDECWHATSAVGQSTPLSALFAINAVAT